MDWLPAYIKRAPADLSRNPADLSRDPRFSTREPRFVGAVPPDDDRDVVIVQAGGVTSK